jgi:hypothetical protein
MLQLLNYLHGRLARASTRHTPWLAHENRQIHSLNRTPEGHRKRAVTDSQHQTDNTIYFSSSHVRVKIVERMGHPVLHQAGVDAVAYPDEQGLVIGAERDPGHLTEEVDLLPFLVVCGCAVHVHEVGGLREHQEPPVGGVADAPDCADVAPKDCKGGRQVAHVPDAAGFVLVPCREGAPIWVPCRCE